ncbi:hypothetical protein FJTKL_11669 [Diaporthe vaccinii]|uniref:Uncharacterized protein n=1 Tax=Diaporthe vaccinii TaxID=105482 RepID=A0ABR4EFJ5_9PEZI
MTLTTTSTVFDPRINFRFDKGSAATIIFGPRDSGRMRKLPVKDPEINATFEKMEADGVGFNFEFVGDVVVTSKRCLEYLTCVQASFPQPGHFAPLMPSPPQLPHFDDILAVFELA